MENNKNKKSVKYQGDMLNFCDFIQVYVFTRNHHLNINKPCILGFGIMKNNIKKAPVKFWEDLLYFQHFMQIFVFAPN